MESAKLFLSFYLSGPLGLSVLFPFYYLFLMVSWRQHISPTPPNPPRFKSSKKKNIQLQSHQDYPCTSSALTRSHSHPEPLALPSGGNALTGLAGVTHTEGRRVGSTLSELHEPEVGRGRLPKEILGFVLLPVHPPLLCSILFCSLAFFQTLLFSLGNRTEQIRRGIYPESEVLVTCVKGGEGRGQGRGIISADAVGSGDGGSR